MALFKKLTPIGNSLGLVIERPVLDLLGIDRGTTLEVITDGDGLHIRPVRQGYLDQVREAARRVMNAHEKTLKKLAD